MLYTMQLISPHENFAGGPAKRDNQGHSAEETQKSVANCQL
jgi:hypothetical protein